MKDHEGDVKQYILLSEAWYASAVKEGSVPSAIPEIDNVMFGFYSPLGGTSGEMGVTWHQLEAGKLPVPRLECYCDAWHALAQLKDVIDAMAEVDGQDITPKEFCALLERCGFSDATPRKRKGAE